MFWSCSICLRSNHLQLGRSREQRKEVSLGHVQLHAEPGCLGLLLPLRLAAVVDAGEFADLVESCVAHRLVFQANAPMKARLTKSYSKLIDR